MKRAMLLLLALMLLTASCAAAEESRDEEWTLITAALTSDEPNPVPAEWMLPAPDRNLSARDGLDDGIMNILLMSTDAPALSANRGRTDVMALCSVDTATGGVKLIVLPEIKPVQIDGLPGEIRLKYVNCFGGPLWAAQAVNRWLGLNVTRYCAVNQAALTEAVDALGGVQIALTDTERDVLEMPADANVLDGAQALRYVKLRRAGNAWERPRTLMEALLRGVRTQGIDRAALLVEKLLPLIDTNLTSLDVIVLTLALLGGGASNLEAMTLTVDEADAPGWIYRAVYGES